MASSQAIIAPLPTPARADTTRSLILMGECGDCELSWEPERDEEIKALVTRMMGEGVTFFQLKKGVFRRKREKIERVEDIQSRLVSVADKDFEALYFNGAVEMTRRSVGKIETTGRIIKDPAEVARSHTVGTQRLVGG